MKYTLQVAPEDCTGCGLCVEVCPAKDKQQTPAARRINMAPQPPLREQERENWDFFLQLPESDRSAAASSTRSRASQLLQPLFEFSGACAGCGETPYVKLLTQLFGDRAIIANATGCSSIYGGNLPTTPWTTERRRPRPGLVELAVRGQRRVRPRHAADARQADRLRPRAAREAAPSEIGDELVDAILQRRPDTTRPDRSAARARRGAQGEAQRASTRPSARDLLSVADYLVKKSVWIVGGDGWAYDIGYGGLDHVLASGRNVNVLVLDTEVYSNTGGQMSRPRRGRGGQVRRRRQAAPRRTWA